jgi:hypothetical protein
MSREEIAGIPVEMPWRIYVPRHKSSHRDEVILVVSFPKSM